MFIEIEPKMCIIRYYEYLQSKFIIKIKGDAVHAF